MTTFEGDDPNLYDQSPDADIGPAPRFPNFRLITTQIVRDGDGPGHEEQVIYAIRIEQDDDCVMLSFPTLAAAYATTEALAKLLNTTMGNAMTSKVIIDKRKVQ